MFFVTPKKEKKFTDKEVALTLEKTNRSKYYQGFFSPVVLCRGSVLRSCGRQQFSRLLFWKHVSNADVGNGKKRFLLIHVFSCMLWVKIL